MHGVGARALFSERDLLCALQACSEGFQVVRIMRVIDQIDISKIITGYCKITTGFHELTGYFQLLTGYFQTILGYSKFANVYDCSHSLPDGTMRVTGVMIGG